MLNRVALSRLPIQFSRGNAFVEWAQQVSRDMPTGDQKPEAHRNLASYTSIAGSPEERLSSAERFLKDNPTLQDADQLNLIRSIAQQILHDQECRTGASLIQPRARCVAAIAGLRLYEISGALPLLIEAVDHLRKVRAELEQRGIGTVTTDDQLATALVRLGEQTQDVQPVREAIALLDRRQPFGADEYALANARAVAQLNIGSMTSDSALVERAAREIQAYLRDHSLHPAAAAMTQRNVVALLHENAHQTQSARLYDDLRRVLEPRLCNAATNEIDVAYAHYFINVLLALARIEGRTDFLDRAIEVAGEMTRACRSRPQQTLGAIHLLANAHVRRYEAGRRPDDLRRAIQILREGLALCGTDAAFRDGRRLRLQADLVHYHAVLAMTGEGSLDDARKQYEGLLTSISADLAPDLYARVALGLFDIEFRERDWMRAAEIAEGIERAFDRLELDPRVSVGVYDQGARQRAGLADKRACCLLELGRATEASIVLERGRGRRLALAVERWRERDRGIDEAAGRAIAQAEAALREALAGGDDRDCRLAWERYGSARRLAGLDLVRQANPLDDLRAAVPEGGAFVQLTFSQYGSRALIWSGREADPHVVDLPSSAYQAIAGIIHGDADRSSWVDAYSEYRRNADDPDDETACRAATAWSEQVGTVLSILGREVMGPLGDALDRAGLDRGCTIHLAQPGGLAFLPLGAARIEDGVTFADRWSAGIVPNAAVLSGRMEPGSQRVCISEPAGQGVRPQLTMAAREAWLLQDADPEWLSLEDDAATPAGALEAMMAGGLVHVACHGIYEEAEAGRSGIELAHGSRLTLNQIAAASMSRLPIRLVFLSCCEGGVSGRTLDHDEHVGLPVAFLQLGAGGVVAALWVVADAAAMALALRFYEDYLDESGAPRCTPATALASACRWLRDVTAAELLGLGYFTREELADLARVMPEPRLPRASLPEKAPDRAFTRWKTAFVSDEKPFAAPMHWAAWVLTGC